MYHAYFDAYGRPCLRITTENARHEYGPFLSIQEANRFGRAYVERYDV